METKDVLSILEQLTLLNRSGVAFLFSFGITWLVCGLFWMKASKKSAGYVTLYQGTVALPLALGVSFWMGAFSQRPGGAVFTQLIITIVMSQMLILPLIIVMQAKKQYTLIPFVFSASLTIHFVLYSWIYQTWSYIVMSVMIAVGGAIIYAIDQQDVGGLPSSKASAQSCFLSGTMLIFTAVVFLFL